MAFTFLKWSELIITCSRDQQMKICNTLNHHNIQTKTKIYTTRNRLSRNVIYGANAMTVNSSNIISPLSDQYRIYVKKTDLELDKHIIRHL